MSDCTRRPIVIRYDETPAPIVLPHPCAEGHLWAWLTGGGLECERCGVRP